MPMLTLSFQASCGAGNTQVASLTLTHTGLGNAQDIRSVYALNGYQRITRSGHFNQIGKTTIRFMKPLTVAACTKQSIVIAADFDADAESGGEHGVSIQTKNDVQTTASEITLVTETEESTVANVAGGTTGKITVTYLPLRGNLRYGATQALARLQLTASGTSDSLLKSITLTNDGTARDSNFSDLRMETSAGETISNIAGHLDGKTVHLTFTPNYILRRGDVKTIVLKGRVTGSALRTVQFLLQEESDLETADIRLR